MKLTQQEKSFIIHVLNTYWFKCIKELARNDIGNIERKNWEKINNKIPKLINKISN